MRAAVPENSAARSSVARSAVSSLQAFQNVRYDSYIRSTGKFDSNMQRSAPKHSMVCS